ncbi:MAG: gluconate 2-dehydrogenase subunit 3 family protein [Xanthobacteraceae bacterium]
MAGTICRSNLYLTSVCALPPLPWCRLMDSKVSHLSRRTFLTSAAILLTTSASVVHGRTFHQGMPWAPGAADPPAQVRPGPWAFFTSDEAATIEAIVDRLIPPDDRGPGGRDAGCAVFIDRQLAGPYGRSDGLYTRPPFMPGSSTQGYQNPDSPAGRYRNGLKALADHIGQSRSGKTFRELSAADQDKLLSSLEDGSIKLKDADAKAFFEMLLQDAQQGFFADPIYGGNRDMAGWKLVGFPGARYDYRDWVERHNEPYPLPPVSIIGRADWVSKG